MVVPLCTLLSHSDTDVRTATITAVQEILSDLPMHLPSLASAVSTLLQVAITIIISLVFTWAAARFSV